MSGCQREREALKGVYPNRRWYLKVNKMPDNQVLAIHRRFQQQRKL